MKVNNIKSLQTMDLKASNSKNGLQNNKQNKLNNFNSSPSFGNATDAMIKFWEAVDRGGLFASFTIQDVLGAGIPRTLVARNVGKEQTGKNNWAAVAENALREFLTGPTMFAVPAAVLYGNMKFGGKSHGVPVETIKDFGDIVSANHKNYNFDSLESFRKSCYSDVLENVFSHFDRKDAIDIDSYVDNIIKMESAKKKGFIDNLKGVKVEGSKQDLLTQIIDNYIVDKKARTEGYPDFLTAKIKSGSKEANFDKVLDRMNKFSDDFFNSVKKVNGEEIGENFIKNFTNKRMGGRFATNIAMGALTAVAMFVIPKLYTLSDENPETAAIKGKTSKADADKKTGEVSFQGGGISKLASQLGEKVTPDATGKLSRLASNLESDWINVARPFYIALITVCTIIPRVIQSAKRDIKTAKENGEKIQWDETANILRRDVTTVATILFAMKGMNSIMAHSATKKSGAILTNKILPKDMNPFKKFLQFFKSKDGVNVLSEKQNAARLSYFANGSEFTRMLEDTEANSGNLHKMLQAGSTKKNPEMKKFHQAARELFGDLVDKQDVKASELKAIIDKEGDNSPKIKKLLDTLNDKNTNPLLKSASSTNAWFQTLSLAIITAFLGFGLPKINEMIVSRKYAKNNNNDTSAPANNISTGMLTNLKPTEKQIYQQFLGN